MPQPHTCDKFQKGVKEISGKCIEHKKQGRSQKSDQKAAYFLSKIMTEMKEASHVCSLRV